MMYGKYLDKIFKNLKKIGNVFYLVLHNGGAFFWKGLFLGRIERIDARKI